MGGGSRGRTRGARPPPPRLYLDQTKFFWDTGPHPRLLSKGLDDRTSPLSQGLDPALRAIHGAYPHPSIQMETQSMDCGAVSQTDLNRVTFRLWRRLVRSGSQSKKKICYISPARRTSYLINQVRSSVATLLTVFVYSGFRMMKLEYTCYVLERSNELFSDKKYNF